MDEQNRRSLSAYRMESAEEHLKASKLLLDAGLYKDSIGRSYYAMFAAARALLALDGKDFSKHSGVISYFQKEYIKTRKIDVKYSRYIVNAFQVRNHADYEDYYIVANDDAVEQYENAAEFCEAIKEFIKAESYI
ncbi:MAG: HEPN domain-containing protein [Oscillospiraceae bacterium]|nr:HEPN domain-containing protein [Oscillospiraceae bacterium]